MLDRVRDCLLGPQIEKLANWLLTAGYARSTMSNYLRTAAYFSSWLETKSISPGDVRMSHFREFHQSFVLPRKGEPSTNSEWSTTSAVGNHLMRIIHEAQPPKKLRRDPVQKAVDEFSCFLRETRGLRSWTIRQYCYYLDLFLRDHISGRAFRPERIAPQTIRDYVISHLKTHSSDYIRRLNTVLRAYYRFLIFNGRRCDHQLAAIPCIPAWRTSAPPTVLNAAQCRKFLKAFDRSSAIGKRNYAMAVCMLELGLRRVDTVSLKLEDIDWRQGVLTVPNRKQRHAYTLPLINSVGEALAEYIRHGRPVSDSTHIFLRHMPPRTPLSSISASWPIRCAFIRAGISPLGETHILRRSIASRMHAGGAGVKEIADFLGHNSLETARLYARTDEKLLRAFVLPWPEGSK